jgi:hypothetical protein
MTVEFGYFINSYMKTHKLMIKTHVVTGLKYLCYTRSEGEAYSSYKGSGTRWKKHLAKHGDDIATELIYETASYEDFKKFAISKSIEFDVVQSDDWANLKIEEGDGGDTVSNKMWITDGQIDKYILKDSLIPEGWSKGRSNCVFNDKDNQRKFGKLASTENKIAGMKKAWSDGKMDKRDNSKCGCKGENNVACRPEVRAKISKAAKERSEEQSERAKKTRFWEKSGRWKNKNDDNDIQS